MKLITIFSLGLVISSMSYANHTTDQITKIMGQGTSISATKQIAAPKLPKSNLSPIRQLIKDHEFVFFYSSTCPHCQKFDPVFRQFLNNYKFKHMDFSFDGQTLPGFEDAVLPQPSLISKFFPGGNVTFPTVFLVNTKTLVTYIISVGEKTYPEFLARMKHIAPDIIRFDKGVGR